MPAHRAIGERPPLTCLPVNWRVTQNAYFESNVSKNCRWLLDSSCKVNVSQNFHPRRITHTPNLQKIDHLPKELGPYGCSQGPNLNKMAFFCKSVCTLRFQICCRFNGTDSLLIFGVTKGGFET